MKKLKTLGIVSMAVLVLITSAFAIFAALGFFKIETDENGKNELIFTLIQKKNKFFEWQTTETEGDITAVFKTTAGDFSVKLADCSAAEKFIELDDAGTFDGMEFSVLMENMFIQSSLSGESFSPEKPKFACINGALGFVLEKGEAYPSLVIITAEELSNVSKGFLSKSGFNEEKKELYQNFGGVPEYEEKVLVFGMVVSGNEIIEMIEKGEKSDYIGGYSALEPVKINSVEISFPTEEN